MPSVKPGSKILVTGATGFVAAWIIRRLLERGFRVRGTVRSEAKEFGEKFEFIVVPDMSKEDAYDEAVKGIDGVKHVASPVDLNADDPQSWFSNQHKPIILLNFPLPELIQPAISGTLGILSSISKYGTSVKRLVVTSSAVALCAPPPPSDRTRQITESDWDESSPKEVQEQGSATPIQTAYRASKVLAEKAAWNFMEGNKELRWDLVTIIPPWVFGPFLHKVPSPSGLGWSLNFLYKVIRDESSIPGTSLAEPFGGSAHYVDVRDLADAHVKALEIEEAGNERFIVSAGVFTWQDIVDSLSTSSLVPSLPKLPRGIPGSGKSAHHNLDLNSSKAHRILEMKFMTLEQTAIDTTSTYKERGWLD
ncbi:NAD(P)-binding protein [Ramaria rubella]|nr:NAD(P)-binding protein [Ramaria rubella]